MTLIQAASGNEKLNTLRHFFNNHHDKLLCTASADGQPNVAFMGTPRQLPDGTIEFEISDEASVTLRNIHQNRSVVFIAWETGERARDYCGARIHAQVTEIHDKGEKLERIRQNILLKHGAHKAAELRATVSCVITRVRPIVDRGQPWDQPPVID